MTAYTDDRNPDTRVRTGSSAALRLATKMVFIGVCGGTWWSLSGHLEGLWLELAAVSVLSGLIVAGLSRYLIRKFLLMIQSWVPEIPNRVQDRIIDQATEHFSALSRNVNRSLKINDYGAVISDTRYQAALEFLQSIGVEPGHGKESLYVNFVLRVVKEIEAEFAKVGFSPDSAPTKGHDFEHWVARELVRFGWKARATAGAGDQGIDVIAEKYGIRVGLQCKRYSSSVGNKSVQEAISGKQYHGLDVAAVITTSSFTRAAKQLAASADVVLMTHYDLPEADRHLLTRQKNIYGD